MAYLLMDSHIVQYRSFEFLECIRMHEFAEGTLHPFERSLYTGNSPCVCLFPTPSPSVQPHESLASSPPVLIANTFYGSGPLRPRDGFSLTQPWSRMKSNRRSIWSTQTWMNTSRASVEMLKSCLEEREDNTEL
ncbi:hypothetical protein C4D60_Mb02t15500 [Musa balbisiana]|uniref:Uncharacterized protein n=1 Tax=Musa balbisiana TaxID=52838 RepID=A0A4S8IAY9_MUSBA|nr:hypothetical protein C4D60_Mb02t15500 [Musa balbisiana]